VRLPHKYFNVSSFAEHDPVGKTASAFLDQALEFLAASAVLSSSAIRYRTSIWQRDRNVLLAGPASSAACITFDRPSAKSNSSERQDRRSGQKFQSLIQEGGCRLSDRIMLSKRRHVEVFVRQTHSETRLGLLNG
jgi:hypothetical protein